MSDELDLSKEKILALKVVEDSLLDESTEGKIDYFVDGIAIDAAEYSGPVSCILQSQDNGVSKIIVSDGPYTGMEISVKDTYLTRMTSETFDSISKNLFKGA